MPNDLDKVPSKDNAKGERLIVKHGDKSAVLKRALKYHLAGLGGARSGLVFKALEKLANLVQSTDDAIALQAVDKVIKLLPYAVTREENPGQGALTTNGPVQINITFDEQVKQRLQGTHLQRLMDIVVPDSAQPSSEVSTPPPYPGGDPLKA